MTIAGGSYQFKGVGHNSAAVVRHIRDGHMGIYLILLCPHPISVLPGSMPFLIWISLLFLLPGAGWVGSPGQGMRCQSHCLLTKSQIVRNKAPRRLPPCAEPREAILRGYVS